MKLLIANNLDSGLRDNSVFSFARDASKFADEICIRSAGADYDPRAFLYDADKFDAVICSGGDGTLANIAHMMADTHIPLLPYPGGTANLLNLNLYQPTDDPALANMIKCGNTLDFDLGEITLQNGDKRGFSIMSGAGYDATIMKDAISTKRLLGAWSYAKAAIKNFAPQFAEISLDIDGKRIKTSGVGVLIMNFCRIQFDLSIIHNNNPRDGLLDVVVFRTDDAIGLLPALFSAILDRGGDFPSRGRAFEIYSGKNITVDCKPSLPIQFDGELTDCTTPFSATVRKHATRFIICDEAISHYGNL